jgi:hypothetical protein
MDMSNDAESIMQTKESNQIKSYKLIDLNKDDGYVDEDDDRTSNNTEKSSNEEVENCDPENEPVDPRVQIELEKLNKSCSDVNRLENELDVRKFKLWPLYGLCILTHSCVISFKKKGIKIFIC